MQTKHRVTLVKTREGCQILETTPRYNILVNGQKQGQLYYNMTGYVGGLPLPNGMKLDIGEHGITEFRRTVAQINRGEFND